MTGNLVVRIYIASLSAGPGDISTVQNKLDSPAFLDQLNAQGFKASEASLEFITSIASELSMSSTSGECAILGIHYSMSIPWVPPL